MRDIIICPVTDKPCRTNGCGEKCYKRDTLDNPKPKPIISYNAKTGDKSDEG